MLEVANTDATQLRAELGIPKQTTKLLPPVAIPRGKGRPNEAEKKRQSVFTKTKSGKKAKVACTADGDTEMKEMNKCSSCEGTGHNCRTCATKGWQRSTLSKFINQTIQDAAASSGGGGAQQFTAYMEKGYKELAGELKRRGGIFQGAKAILAQRLVSLDSLWDPTEALDGAEGEHLLTEAEAATTIETAFSTERVSESKMPTTDDNGATDTAPEALQVDFQPLTHAESSRAAEATNPDLADDEVGAVYGGGVFKNEVLLMRTMRRLQQPDPLTVDERIEEFHLNDELVNGYLWHVQRMHLGYNFTQQLWCVNSWVSRLVYDKEGWSADQFIEFHASREGKGLACAKKRGFWKLDQICVPCHAPGPH